MNLNVEVVITLTKSYRPFSLIAQFCALVLLLTACSNSNVFSNLLSDSHTVALVELAQGIPAIQQVEKAIDLAGYSLSWEAATYSGSPELEAYVDLPANYSMLLIPVVGHRSAVLTLGYEGNSLVAASLVAIGWDGMVDICHYPPGNPDMAHTITVEQEDLKAHVGNHDDTFGPCAADRESYSAEKEIVVRRVYLFDNEVTEVSGTASITASAAGELQINTPDAELTRHTYTWETTEDIAEALDFSMDTSKSSHYSITPLYHCEPHDNTCPPNHSPPDEDESDAGGGGGTDDDKDDGASDGDDDGGSAHCEVPASLEYKLAEAEAGRAAAELRIWRTSSLVVGATGGTAWVCGTQKLRCPHALGGFSATVGVFVETVFDTDAKRKAVRAAKAAIKEYEANCSTSSYLMNPNLHSAHFFATVCHSVKV